MDLGDASTASSSVAVEHANTSAQENGPVTDVRTCNQWKDVFAGINNYFREEDILAGSEHSSTYLGYIIIVAYSIVIMLGTFGNSLTILAVLRNKAMQTTRNFFIFNLALSDLFMCIVTAPTTLYTVLYMFWPFGTTPCKIAGSLQGLNIFLSTFSITAIALDRYVLVIFPTKRKRQHNLALLFFTLIWVISFFLALPLLDASDLNVLFHDKNCDIKLTICHEKNERWQQMIISKEAYTIGVLVLQYSFPLISIVFAYSRIARRMGTRFAVQNSLPDIGYDAVVNRRRKSIADRQRRTHFLMISLVVVFAVAWLPLNVFHLLNSFFWINTFNVPTFALCHVFGVGSACLNPLSYAFFNQNFRSEFAAIFKKIGLIRLHDHLTSLLKVSRQSATKSKNFTTAAETIMATAHYNAMTEVDVDADLKTAMVSATPRNASSSQLVVITNIV